MEITNLKGLIENKLAIIDIENRESHNEPTTASRNIRAELHGIAQALNLMGFNLVFDVNPYFYDDAKPSTYKISLL